jgi:cell division septation protein DedD
MNDHHLDDLIIGDPEPGSSKSKTLLTIIALLIVILIIGLILWALLSDSSVENSNAATASPTQQTKPLAPDLIPIDKPNNETPVAKPKPKPEVKSEVKPTPVKPKSKPVVVQPKPVQKTKPAAPKPTIKEPVQPATNQSSAEAAPTKPAIIENENKTVYYVQVGAFKRDPSPKFIKKLKENGFTFITKTNNGIRRVRVGPYDGYMDAKAALPDIKSKLGVDGLIVKY